VSPQFLRQQSRMTSVAQVAIHRSQFPENVRQDLLAALRARQVNHKFHYDSVKQTQKWLALHEAYSPARTDDNCAATYDAAFTAVTGRITEPAVHLIGLGCGGGQKDARLLQLLRDGGKRVACTPSDVSVAMVLVARAAALAVIAEGDCHPLVCDLATADDLATVLHERSGMGAARLITFFGMIPNFEPELILPRLAALVRPADHLLFSANLAPGADYEAGVRQVLPLYDNALTRDWLMTFLQDLGVAREDGEMLFNIETVEVYGLKRITANYEFPRNRELQVDGEKFVYTRGDKIRLFFSYRYTPDLIRSLLAQHRLNVLEEWITDSGEEGVFLCQRRAG
jgi:uncharacterized SAM-dependent methyltransferase